MIGAYCTYRVAKEVYNMTYRYDFEYWPPLPLEQEPVEPISDGFDYELCEELLCSDDPMIRQALHASGEWLDIEDFWLEAKPPKDSNLIYDPQLYNLAAHGEETKRVLNKRHLSNATLIFRELAYDIADLSHYAESPLDDSYHDSDGSTTGQLLAQCIFNDRDRTCGQEELLIRRDYVTDLYHNKEFMPWALGPESHLLIAKVALNWTVEIDAFGAGLIDLRNPQ